jgi:hypothetical protein
VVAALYPAFGRAWQGAGFNGSYIVVTTADTPARVFAAWGAESDRILARPGKSASDEQGPRAMGLEQPEWGIYNCSLAY